MTDDLEIIREYFSKNPHFINLSTRINKLIEFIDFLSSLIFNTGHSWICISGNKAYVYQTDHLDSAVKTLNSIKICSNYGISAMQMRWLENIVMIL